MSNKNAKSTKVKKSSKESKPIEDTDTSLFDTDSSSDSDSDTESIEQVQNDEENDKLSDDDMGVDDEDQDSESNAESDKDVDDECIYKYTKSSKIFNEEFNDDIDDDEDTDIEKVTDNNRYVKPEDRIGKPYLFKFERVRLLQDRAVQLANGSNPMIKNVSHLDPIQIAKLELETKKIPLYIERQMPGGKIEIWHVSELTQSDREFVQDDSVKLSTKKIKSFPTDV